MPDQYKKERKSWYVLANLSENCLMWSLIMLSIGLCNQTGSNWKPNHSLIPNVHSIIVTIRLMFSVTLCPKVITLSSFNCSTCLGLQKEWETKWQRDRKTKKQQRKETLNWWWYLFNDRTSFKMALVMPCLT